MSELIYAQRLATLECGHRPKIGGGTKQFPRLYCCECHAWQRVTRIEPAPGARMYRPWTFPSAPANGRR